MNTRETWWSLVTETGRLVGAVFAHGVDRLVDRVAPVDVSRAEAHREALVAAEEYVEVWESESNWLGNSAVSAVSADAESSPGAVCDVPPSPAPGHLSPSSVELHTAPPRAADGEGPAEVRANLSGAPAGHPQHVPPLREKPRRCLVAWLTPAICDVLAEHEPATFEDQTRVSCGDSVGAHHHQSFPDQQAWRDHVAPLIAERVANLLPLIQPK